ncbi:virulence factor TspB C-terminal domain-related protein [Methylobacillus sp. Pita1]|uniref:virulence factor TspB C-terminal domain-related protein n=1 Tax=Methylobacillus sp. Pita1 TaxID=3382642 RepID=UPI0038B60BBF
MRLLALIPLLLIGATAQAAIIDIGTPSTIRTGPEDKWYFFPPKGYTDVTFPSDNPRTITAPTTKGGLPVTLNQRTSPNIAGLGSAALNLAKRAGPLGAGLTIAGILCSETDICSWSDPDNPAAEPVWSITDPSNAPYPYQHFEFGQNVAQAIGQSRFSTSNQLCEASLAYYNGPGAASSGISTVLPLQGVADCYLVGNDVAVKVIGSDGNVHGQFVPGRRVQSCDNTTHYLSGSQCLPLNPDRRIPVPPTGWPSPDDVPGLRTPDIIPDLINGEEPVPVETPAIDPKTVPGPGGSTTETVRDGNGNPIGTKVTDTTVTITPTGPTTVEVTETTTTTETNITNNTTTVTTTETTLPNNEDQSEEPKEDQDIEIDDVEDQDLDTHEIPDTFSYESWGGGSCPGDPTISARGHSYSLPVHTVCEAITDMRPAVLLIAALVSAYIISGAFRQ